MSLYGKFNPRRAFSLVEPFDLDEPGDVASFWVENDELANAFWRMHIDMMDDASGWAPEDVDRQSAMSAVRRLRKIADKLEGIANAGANEPAWVNGEWRIGSEVVLAPPEQETITIRLVLRVKPKETPKIIVDECEAEDE